MTKTFSAACVVLFVAAGQAEAVSRDGVSACDSAIAARAYPTFCAIPATPSDIRNPDGFHSAVIETRMAGRGVITRTAPGSFALPVGAAEAFATSARVDVEPPPPMTFAGGTPPSAADTEAFADEARRRVTPPPKSHR